MSTANNTHKKLDKLEIDGTKYYILNGTYIAPFASQLVMNIEVNGIMLDTTSSILSRYLSSIPTIIIQNVGIPIGMSFGLTEDASIYNEFFFHFHNIYGYEIPDFVDVVESDQGKALIKAVHDQGMRHICYLRHLLVSLGWKTYSNQVGNLITATTDDEYQRLKSIFDKYVC